jgi:hypothetical protein
VKKSGEMKKFSLGIFIIAAIIAMPFFSTGEAGKNETRVYVEGFKEIFHVRAASETIQGLNYAVSAKLTKILRKEKGIIVIHDLRENPDFIISGTVTLDTQQDPKKILITIELKDRGGEILKTETHYHVFEDYPASLDKDADYISNLFRSLLKK